MPTIKSYTDISQSKVLSKILPLESADMYYPYNGIETYPEVKNGIETETAIPCWSLAALLGVLPVIDLCAPSLKMKLTHRYYVEVYLSEQKRYIATDDYESPVDACVAMIEKLNELNLL